MAYQVSLKKRAIEAFENIDEPYYSKIKTAIYELAGNPRPHGLHKTKRKKWLSDSDGRLSYHL